MGKLRQRVEKLARQTVGAEEQRIHLVVGFVGTPHDPVVPPPGVKVYEENGKRYFYRHDEDGKEMRATEPQHPNGISLEYRFIVTEP